MSKTQRGPLASNSVRTSALRRECFITVGATASFRSLLNEALGDAFFLKLSELEYTHLTVQCGPDLEYARSIAHDTRAGRSQNERKLKGESMGVKWTLFDFNKLGLGAEMRGCKGLNEGEREGVVVCHAGAGTILDAMRLDVPIIVVPNPALLDNHQAELAKELERQGYVTHGHLHDLPAALGVSEIKSKAKMRWQPANPGADPTGNGVVGVMDEELGYENRMREALD